MGYLLRTDSQATHSAFRRRGETKRLTNFGQGCRRNLNHRAVGNTDSSGGLLSQDLQNVLRIFLCSEVPWRIAIVVLGLDVGASGNKLNSHLAGICPRCFMERRLAPVVLGVDIGAAIDEIN